MQLARIVHQDEIAVIEREWAELSARMKTHRDVGTDPSDPEVRALAERWRDLTERTISGFTGGDPDITESLGVCTRRKVRRRPPAARSTPTCWNT